MTQTAAIFGCLATRLSPQEFAFFRDAAPWGFILFARNIENPAQIRALCAELRESVGRHAPILIDQEGGRVARLTAPLWREWLPPLAQMERGENLATARQAMALRYRLIAAELTDLGIDVNCAPMLDVPTANAHDIILNRCYGRDADTVAEIGRAVADSLLAGGVLPIIKHIPGHGRATLDSHLELPRVDASVADLQTDFTPFRRLSDLPMAMTAHILYPALDSEECATFSVPIIRMIRDDIGFDGLLMSDDLSMKALAGGFTERAKKTVKAGCDIVLHCNGDPAEMTAILTETPALAGQSLTRADAALALRTPPEPFDADLADRLLKPLLNALDKKGEIGV